MSRNNRLKCQHPFYRCNRVVTRKVVNKATGIVSYRCSEHAKPYSAERYDHIHIGT